MRQKEVIDLALISDNLHRDSSKYRPEYITNEYASQGVILSEEKLSPITERKLLTKKSKISNIIETNTPFIEIKKANANINLNIPQILLEKLEKEGIISYEASPVSDEHTNKSEAKRGLKANLEKESFDLNLNEKNAQYENAESSELYKQTNPNLIDVDFLNDKNDTKDISENLNINISQDQKPSHTQASKDSRDSSENDKEKLITQDNITNCEKDEEKIIYTSNQEIFRRYSKLKEEGKEDIVLNFIANKRLSKRASLYRGETFQLDCEEKSPNV